MPYFIQSKILETFLQVLNMSLTASIIIVFVLVARLLMKKAPKIFSYVLWSIVFFRLLCPISFESMFSLLPINANPISTNTINSEMPQIITGITAVDNTVNPMLPAPASGDSANPLQVAAGIGESLWLIGIVVLLIYSIVSLLRLRKNMVGAVKLRDNIFLADRIASPFVIGLLRPKIYLPSTLSEQEQGYIILHEQTHIRRLDHVMKIVAFAALCIHWFNPLVWIAFTLMIKDMEMSCDESVMKKLGAGIREEYSASLLSLATGRKIIAGTPLAFGEGDTKRRIKNVLNYKKPALWVMLAALIAVAAICIAFASNPQRASMEWAKNLRVEDVEKIEVIAWPNNTQEPYRLFDRSEFSKVVELVNSSRGRYLPNPEPLVGDSVIYYITTTDGVRHEFGDTGYLLIDGDFYSAGSHWLSSLDHVKGNAPVPETFRFGNAGKTIEISNADRIELILGNTGSNIEIVDSATIQNITSHINSLTYSKGGSSKNATGWSYKLKWYGADGNMIDEIVIMDSSTINYQGYFYSVSGVGIDLEFFNFEKRTEDDKTVPSPSGAGPENIQNSEVEPITFWVKPDETPQGIGQVAVMQLLNRYKVDTVSNLERITDYTVNNVDVISETPKSGESWQDMPYHYAVRAEYSIETATEEYLSSSDGISGKGLFEGLFIELCVKSLGDGNYEIVSIAKSGLFTSSN